MCRFYGLRATHPTTAECCLVHARNSLMVQSRQDLQGFRNADGWGIAAYGDGEVRFRRRSHAAHQSEEFRAAAARVRSPTILAHVRRATVGAVDDANTHPFTHGRFAFVHNGTVPYFERVRGDMLDAMGRDHRRAVQGTTDSEHLFHVILAALTARPDRSPFEALRATLARTTAWCRRVGAEPRLGLNVLLTDGERMVGSRWRRSLSWLERHDLADCEICGVRHADCHPQDYRALVIASEPTTREPWQPVPERSLFEVTPDLRLRVEPLDPA